MTTQPWPYPFWIAHRGAGQLAPENTLSAFKLGASYGYRMFECDVKLSADGVPFLMHDTTLTRTTNAAQVLGENVSTVGGDHAWSVLARLDAGAWHSAAHHGEPLALLEDIARYCLKHQLAVNLEIKPTPGAEHHTGEVVARISQRLWQDSNPHLAPPPLLSSFEPASLQAAKAAVPQLPRALLLDELWTGWQEVAHGLDLAALVLRHTLWDETLVQLARSAGWRCLSYTVNTIEDVNRLRKLGTDGIITDRVDLFPPELSPN
ncbi:MAG: hypothetical protein RL459_50 [Pseudomonadota bacterium]|jgi:glycerophosphoryl diester phosphodiesterase